MDTLFNAQPLAFDSFGRFTENQSEMKYAQSMGQSMDPRFTEVQSVDSTVSFSGQFEKFFREENRRWIQPAASQATNPLITSGLGTFALTEGLASAQANAGQVVAMDGGIGSHSAKRTMAVVRAALTIASRVSGATLKRIGAHDTVGDRQMTEAFANNEDDERAALFAGIFTKIIGKNLVKQNLYTYSSQDSQSHFSQVGTDAMPLRGLMAGSNLKEEADFARNVTNGNTLADRQVKKQAHGYKFSYQLGETPTGVRIVGEEQKSWNGFKPAAAGRFEP